MGNSNCKTWEESYQLAKEYYEEHGDLNVPIDFITKDGYWLGRWIRAQKTHYFNQNLSLERIEKLTCIGLDFCSTRRNKTWEESYQLAKEYYEEYGDLNVPRNYITKNGFKLGSWISTQKCLYSNNNLSLERKEKLTCIGLDFCSIRHLNTWEESCEIAKEYYEEHGDLNVPYRYITKDGFHLGAWISIQKQAFANNKLSEDKIKILQNLMDLDTKWLKYYKRLLECYQLYGSLNLSEDFVDENGLGIGKWLHKQVSLYEENKLGLFKKEKFDELNIVELYKTGTLIQITRINKFVYSLCIKLGIDPEINGEVLSSLSLKDFRNTLISLQEKNIPFCDLDGHLNSAFSMKDTETNFILKKTK